MYLERAHPAFLTILVVLVPFYRLSFSSSDTHDSMDMRSCETIAAEAKRNSLCRRHSVAGSSTLSSRSGWTVVQLGGQGQEKGGLPEEEDTR